MNSIQQLTEYFQQFPGIGPRQARRFVYFLLTRNDASLAELSDVIKKLKADIRICQSCFRFFQKNTGNSPLCDICNNPNRENNMLMIVSRDADLETIERAHSYNGKYFVLGGSVPILEKNPDQKIRSKELLKIVETRTSNKELEEVIIAVNATTEGENTGDYVVQILKPFIAKSSLKISHLGRGISTGTELEYSDSDTIKNALKNRQ